MKRIKYVFLAAVLGLIAVFASDSVLNIHTNDTKVLHFVVDNIDSLTVTNDYSDVRIHKKDGSLSVVPIDRIDSTVFATGDFKLPVVTTVSAEFNYNTNNAVCVVRVNENGGCVLTERGIVWATHANPTLKDQKFAQGTSVGQFYALMTGLELNKTYYVRAFATNCAGTGYGNVIKVQPLMGNVTYTLAQDVINAGEEIHNLIKTAMDSACFYYNRYTPFRRNIWVYYNAGIPTAQASYLGSIGFGANKTFMWVGTAMHEMAHYFGSGTTQVWKSLMVGGVWQGKEGQRVCLELTGQQLRGDNNSNPIHYWPTGINYRSEVSSQKDLIDHAKVVKAMLVDDCKLPYSW